MSANGAKDDNGPAQVACCYDNHVSRETAKANARLIAAAPDMLAALKDARLQIEYLEAEFQPTGTSAGVLARINAVIAKATIEQ